MALLAIIRDTLRQAVSQVIIFVLLGIAATIVALALFAVGVNEMGRVEIFGEPLNYIETDMAAGLIRTQMISVMFGIGAMLFIFTASFLTTRKLRPGVVELYVSKPVSRTTIMLGRCIGIFLVYYIPAALAIIGVYLTINAKIGASEFNFLNMLGFAALAGLVLTGLCAGFGSLSRSPVLGLLVLSMLWIITPILIPIVQSLSDETVASYTSNERPADDDIYPPERGSTMYYITRMLIFIRRYIILPTLDLHTMAAGAELPGGKIHTWRPLWVALAQAAIGFGIAFYSFNRKNF